MERMGERLIEEKEQLETDRDRERITNFEKRGEEEWV